MAKPFIEESEVNGLLKLKYNFHAGQLAAINSTKRIVLILAGTRGGKTSFGPAWLVREMVRKGPGDYLVAAPTYKIIDKAAGPEIEHQLGRLMGLGSLVRSPLEFRISDQGQKILWGKVHERPSRILFGHADDPESLEAMTAKAAWLDEAGQRRFKLGSWEAIQRRLSMDQGRVLLTTTPYDLGWLKQQIHDPWLQSGKNHPRIDVIGFTSLMNPAFPREEYDIAHATYQGWKFNMFYRGTFTRPAGLIYDSFNDTRDVIPPFAIPDKWSRYLGLDFGGANTAGTFYAKDYNSGVYYLYREYHAGSRTARQHVEALLAGEKIRPTAVGGSHSEGQWRNEFAAAGLAVHEPAVKEVDVGIGRVYAAHATGKIKVFSTCKRYLEQKATYSYRCDEQGEPLGTGEIEDKHDFHYLDAERYVIGWLERPGGTATIGTSKRGNVVDRMPSGVFLS